jgi:hypothetical protein
MMENLYIVIWRSGPQKVWAAEPRGVFTSRRLADSFVEINHPHYPDFEYAIVEGPIVSPESMEAAEARLGAF